MISRLNDAPACYYVGLGENEGFCRQDRQILCRPAVDTEQMRASCRASTTFDLFISIVCREPGTRIDRMEIDGQVFRGARLEDDLRWDRMNAIIF